MEHTSAFNIGETIVGTKTYDYKPKMKLKQILEESLKSKTSISFDDITVVPDYAYFKLNEIDMSTYFSRNIKLKIPLVSAAMDTVTESALAIELAKLGGLGVIHRNMTPDKQASQVAEVKRCLNVLIENPVCIYATETIAQIIETYGGENGELSFHSFPVLDEGSKLIGMLGEDSFKIGDPSQTAEELTIPLMISAKEGTSIEDIYQDMKIGVVRAIPLVDENREVKGMYVFSDVRRKIEGDEICNIDNKGHLKVGAAIGVLDDAYNRLEKLAAVNVDVVVIDTAHADSADVLETINQIKKDYNIDVVAGNISNGKAVKRLVDAGADGIKVGQGPGSICTTRVVAGIGRAQVTAIYDCAKMAEDYKIPICADGGLRYPGDITKAIAAGANSVMLGSMFAGLEETPGEIIYYQGRKWKSYRGMGSLGAMQESQSSRERYGQENPSKLVPEGVEGIQPYKGPLNETVGQLVGGLKAGMGYAGTKTIDELRQKGDFDRVTDAAREESHPHDIFITKEAPNYPGKEQNEPR